jgi:hypothetical protein
MYCNRQNCVNHGKHCEDTKTKEIKFVGRRRRKYWNGLKMNIRQIRCKDGR